MKCQLELRSTHNICKECLSQDGELCTYFTEEVRGITCACQPGDREVICRVVHAFYA